ncbi:tRNA (N6-threonylcarbamoyladenosine(37)-N6)-methyltransferase TrmO [Psychrobacter phenylpyruvicus]|uniref:Putative methyltransferase, YaeB/AF_0241 family n=1 Tax=Psychrobacter phenylpyruvicus TaxID=29432 RepID=A0A379LJY4_9GAMM|nr:tRNA (N6-threonylcarbamoyladenosine(37)-N6)-methyltransferase TrmO [Psychrobacter phenylpyruvicus]SUD90072.1 putative methyltransferase, YaeB/AF_0241 family [Psychrobacter phenylpyruvicus]
MNQPSVSIPIIGYHKSALPQKFGIPRQPNLVQLPSTIELIAPYDSAEAFEGIESFSHLWITWHTHHNHLAKTPGSKQTLNANQEMGEPTHNLAAFKPKVRPPRLGGNTKLGVFATRSTYRPSQLGLSVVKLIKVERVGDSVTLHISGADMVDGTPIIDIKPYIAYSDAISEAISGFALDKPTVKPVHITEAARHQFTACVADNLDQGLQPEDMALICQLISQDPRPAYRQQQSDRVFYMCYKNHDIGFRQKSLQDDSSIVGDSYNNDPNLQQQALTTGDAQANNQALVIVSVEQVAVDK